MSSKKKSGLQSLIELVLTVAIAVGLALLIQAFVVKPYRIPSQSMVPTLDIGQRVLTNRLINHPSIGDVVVFHPPHGADNRMTRSVRQPAIRAPATHRHAASRPFLSPARRSSSVS